MAIPRAPREPGQYFEPRRVAAGILLLKSPTSRSRKTPPSKPYFARTRDTSRRCRQRSRSRTRPSNPGPHLQAFHHLAAALICVQKALGGHGWAVAGSLGMPNPPRACFVVSLWDRGRTSRVGSLPVPDPSRPHEAHSRTLWDGMGEGDDDTDATVGQQASAAGSSRPICGIVPTSTWSTRQKRLGNSDEHDLHAGFNHSPCPGSLARISQTRGCIGALDRR